MKPFLTARWLNLVNLTWAVEPESLLPFVPRGLVPDTLGGKALISLVAFEFRDTRFMGFRFPYHVNFPEVNLRFYVNDGARRGVVFLRELVSKPLISFIARHFFYERYETAKLLSERKDLAGHVSIEYGIRKGGREHRLHVIAENKLYHPDKESAEYFIENRFFGFSSDRRGRTMMFHVEHPAWELYRLKEYHLHFDFGALYGKHWAFLNEQAPFNAMFIKGSEVGMFPHRVLESAPRLIHAPSPAAPLNMFRR